MRRHSWRALATTGLLSASALVVGAPALAAPTATAANPHYEVWLVDKAANELLVYSNEALDDVGGPRNEAAVVDLGALFAPGTAANDTGRAVSEPQTVDPSPDGRYVAVAFAGSGHVGIIDTASRRPKALVLLPDGGGDGGVSSARWMANGSAVVAANHAAKRIERIDYNAPTDTFIYSVRATLDLAGCRTPSGYPCQSTSDPGEVGPNNRPDTSPVCAIPTDRGHTVVTLEGGGLFMIDSSASPMQIIGVWGNTAIGRATCSSTQLGRYVYLSGEAVGRPGQYSVYQLRDNFPWAPKTISDNDTSRVPKSFFRQNDPGSHEPRGMAIGGSRNVIWLFDRATDGAELFDSVTLNHLGTVRLVGQPGVVPLPGAADVSPDGRWMFTVTGGARDAGSGMAGASQPLGLGIIELNSPGTSGDLVYVLPVSATAAVADPTLDHPTLDDPTTTTTEPVPAESARTVPTAIEPGATGPAATDAPASDPTDPEPTTTSKSGAPRPTSTSTPTSAPGPTDPGDTTVAPVTDGTDPATVPAKLARTRTRTSTSPADIRLAAATTVPSDASSDSDPTTTPATPVITSPKPAVETPVADGLTEPGSLAVVITPA